MKNNLITARTKGILAKGRDSVDKVCQFSNFIIISGLCYSKAETDVSAIAIRPVLYENSGNRIVVINF